MNTVLTILAVISVLALILFIGFVYYLNNSGGVAIDEDDLVFFGDEDEDE